MMPVDSQEWFQYLLRTTQKQVSWRKFSRTLKVSDEERKKKKTCCLDLTHEVHAANYVWLCALTNAGNNLTLDGWIKWGENQYYINENPMYMDDARHYCRQRHGDLISINSKDENTFIWKQVIFSHFHSFWRLNVD